MVVGTVPRLAVEKEGVGWRRGLDVVGAGIQRNQRLGTDRDPSQSVLIDAGQRIEPSQPTRAVFESQNASRWRRPEITATRELDAA